MTSLLDVMNCYKNRWVSKSMLDANLNTDLIGLPHVFVKANDNN